MAQGNKIIGRDRFKELVYAQAFREHRHFYAFLYGGTNVRFPQPSPP